MKYKWVLIALGISVLAVGGFGISRVLVKNSYSTQKMSELENEKDDVDKENADLEDESDSLEDENALSEEEKATLKIEKQAEELQKELLEKEKTGSDNINADVDSKITLTDEQILAEENRLIVEQEAEMQEVWDKYKNHYFEEVKERYDSYSPEDREMLEDIDNFYDEEEMGYYDSFLYDLPDSNGIRKCVYAFNHENLKQRKLDAFGNNFIRQYEEILDMIHKDYILEFSDMESQSNTLNELTNEDRQGMRLDRLGLTGDTLEEQAKVCDIIYTYAHDGINVLDFFGAYTLVCSMDDLEYLGTLNTRELTVFDFSDYSYKDEMYLNNKYEEGQDEYDFKGWDNALDYGYNEFSFEILVDHMKVKHYTTSDGIEYIVDYIKL